MTDEKFDSRVTDKGQTEFVYGISWQNTSQESLLRDGRTQIKRSRTDDNFSQDRPNRLAIQANNQNAASDFRVFGVVSPNGRDS